MTVRLNRSLRFISNCLWIMAIRRGLTLMIPVMIMGSFAIFFKNLPIQAYQDYMLRVFGEGWLDFGTYIHQGSFAIMAVGMLLTISYSLAELSPLGREHEVNPMIAAVVSMGSLFALMNVDNGVLKMEWLGPLGVFIAIVVAGLSAQIFLYLSSLSWLKIKVYSNAADPSITQALSALLPALLTVALFAALHLLMDAAGISDIYKALNARIESLFAGKSSTLSTAIIFVFLVHLSWFFCVHGSNVLEPVTQTIFVPALAVNQQLVAQGLPPLEIFTKQFFDVFIFLGGSGATLCLIVALLLSARRSNTKQIAMISGLPGLINVNEIMVFGIPVVFNIYLLIPFVLLPVVLTIITYAAMSWGIVPLITAQVEWTTPIILGGYKATGSAAGALLQMVNFLVGVIFYLPFIRLHEKALAREDQETMKHLWREVNQTGNKKELVLLNRRDSVGNLARLLTSDLEQDLYEGKIRLEYQPQVNSSNQLIGIEALLRWKHKKYGYIAPPIAIAIAEEAGLVDELGLWIMRTACRQMKVWNDQGLTDIVLSVNVSPSQLDNDDLPHQIKMILQETGINPGILQVEITEQAALGGLKRLELLNKLKAMGLLLAMDDFGMGHSSLMYLKELNLDTIKLDGSLVKEVYTNDKCREIINTIVQLGQSVGFKIVAEYVETAEQRNALLELGCLVYQGFLYSPSLTADEFAEYYQGFQVNP